MEVINPAYMAYLKEDGGKILHCKIIEIGNWNMDTVVTKNVNHGLGALWTKVAFICGMIFNDFLTSSYQLPYGLPNSTGVLDVIISFIDNTKVSIDRRTGSQFDGASFDDDVMNRGYISIFYWE